MDHIAAATIEAVEKVLAQRLTTRLALVGAGAIAQCPRPGHRIRRRRRAGRRRRRRRGRRRRLAGSTGATVLASHEDLAPTLDGAIVCTPPATHESIATDLVAAGIHVLCEKPLAIGAARRVAHGRRRRRRRPAAAHGVEVPLRRRRRPGPDLIASGAIGEPITFENAFTGKVDMRGRWNGDPSISGGGVLIDNGTHSVDIARFLFGPSPRCSRSRPAPPGAAGRGHGAAPPPLRPVVQRAPSTCRGASTSVSTTTSGSTARRARSDSAGRAPRSCGPVPPTGRSSVPVTTRSQRSRRSWPTSSPPSPAGAPRITTADAVASVLVIDAAHRSLALTRWESVPAAPAVAPASI